MELFFHTLTREIKSKIDTRLELTHLTENDVEWRAYLKKVGESSVDITFSFRHNSDTITTATIYERTTPTQQAALRIAAEVAASFGLDLFVVVNKQWGWKSADILTTGENAKHTLALFSLLDDVFNLKMVKSCGFVMTPQGNYRVDYDIKTVTLTVKSGKHVVATLKDRADVLAFIEREKDTAAMYRAAESELLAYAQSLDPTCHVKSQGKAGTRLIFLDNYVPMRVLKRIVRKKEVLCGVFNRQHIMGETMTEIVEGLKPLILSYYKKNRLIAITSKSLTMRERFLTEITGRKLRDWQLREIVESELSDDVIRDRLDLAKEDGLRATSDSENEWFAKKMKLENRRFKLKKGYYVNGLYWFVTASKVLVYDESLVK
jgi:hypothetical protein